MRSSYFTAPLNNIRVEGINNVVSSNPNPIWCDFTEIAQIGAFCIDLTQIAVTVTEKNMIAKQSDMVEI